MKTSRAFALLAALLLAGPAPAAETPSVPTQLTCDHMDMWSVENETHAICTGAVTLTGTNMKILCDRLEITAEGVGDKTATLPMLERFKYLLATGHVRIVQGDREATSGRADVLPRENKLVLTDEPVVIDHGTGWVNAGEKITMLRGDRRVLVEKPRVTGPALKDLGFDKNKPVTPAEGEPKAEPAK